MSEVTVVPLGVRKEKAKGSVDKFRKIREKIEGREGRDNSKSRVVERSVK